jgi:hypothetical protein
MSAMASRNTAKPRLIRDASGDPLRPRRKLPNTRWGNFVFLLKVLAAVPLVPLWPVFLSIEARDAYYVNHYFETILHGLRTLYHAFKNGSWVRIFKYNIFTTPAYIEEQLGARLGACTRCAKCCKMLKCDYLAYNKKDHEYYCSVYNTPYWIFGACGRYPIDQSDIDDYNCPGFAFPESVAGAAAAGAAAPGALLQIGRMPGRR